MTPFQPHTPFKEFHPCSSMNVAWFTHLHRAGHGLNRKGEYPWHTHVYRAARSLLRDPKYMPVPVPKPIPVPVKMRVDAGAPGDSIAVRFARKRDCAGV